MLDYFHCCISKEKFAIDIVICGVNTGFQGPVGWVAKGIDSLVGGLPCNSHIAQYTQETH